MPVFNDAEEDKKVEELHEAEEERLAQMLADKYGVKYVSLIGIPIDPDALALIDEETAREREVAAFEKVGTHIFLAARSPGRELTDKTIKELEREGFEVTLYITSRQSLEKAWTRYQDITFAEKSKEGLLDISSASIEKFSQSASDRESVQNLIEEVVSMKKAHRTTRIVEVILAGAIGLSASDVHIEPEEDIVDIRMRIDGILVPITTVSKETFSLLLSRIKLLSGIKLNINTTAQDGRFTIEIGDRTIEIRSSTLPGAYGESIVMRLLDPESIAVELETLGMRPKILEFVKKELAKPNGMILNTGPTGSGKTTTLYAFLRHIHKPGTKVITIEDPIEYHIDGITQTQVEPEKGYTFLSGLTSALRQDPDIIMVGEIRDEETTKTAIHAALTGHLVFSTLHTNTAAGTFARLIDLEANPDILGSAINFTMAQRLVRKLCPESKKERPVTEEERTLIEKILSTIADKELREQYLPVTSIYDPTPSDDCPDGYRGRTGIFEAIQITNEIDELVRAEASEGDIESAAEKQGILSMKQDGILKVLEGITSLEELRRVIEL